MHSTEIQSFLVSQTRINWPEVLQWLRFLGIKRPEEIIRQFGYLIDQQTGRLAAIDSPVSTDASAIVALAGKRCYNSFDTESGLNPNVSKIREDHAEYVRNILASGHGSVLEHASWTFAIENVSRVFTGEMNRHRAGTAISEGSMRYIRFEDIGFWTPTSIRDENDLLDGLLVDDMKPEEIKEAKALTRELFGAAFQQMEQWQLDLSRIWKIGELKNFTVKKVLTSMFRRIVGMGISTGGVWTLNCRALRHVLEMRASEHAEEEIFYVFDHLADRMIADEPLLFGDFYRDGKSWKAKHHKV